MSGLVCFVQSSSLEADQRDGGFRQQDFTENLVSLASRVPYEREFDPEKYERYLRSCTGSVKTPK